MRLVEEVHRLLEAHLRPGGRAIDATAGNGHDTVLLARAVGPEGRVRAIDLQDAALAATRARLEEAALSGRVELRRGCHAGLLEELADAQPGGIDAVVFNLGYLPGGDKTVRTGKSTTRRALDAAARLLRPGGLLTALAYRGHPGGAEEAGAVEAWMRAAEKSGWRVEALETGAAEATAPPVLWVGRKVT
jgi:predicted O-methyltransferase YrrM